MKKCLWLHCCIWAILNIGFLQITESQGRDPGFKTSAEVKATGPVLIPLVWGDKDNKNPNIWDKKVTKDNEVSIKIEKGFNFLFYSIDYRVEDEIIPLYNDLDKLWGTFITSITGIPMQMKTPDGTRNYNLIEKKPTSFVISFYEWRSELETQQKGLADFLANKITDNITLTQSQIDNVSKEQEIRKNVIKKLDSLRVNTYVLIGESGKSIETYYSQMLYDSQLKQHEQIVDGLKSFIQLATAVVEGQRKIIGKKPQGTRVTVTMSVKAKDESLQKTALEVGTVVVQYFVSSNRPVLFHAGLVYTRLNDINLEKINTLDKGEVFKQIKNPSSSSNLSTFLSYQLAVNAQGDAGILASFGTDIPSPGKRLYLGVTGNFGSFLITLGASTASIKEGENLLTEDLFKTIKVKREWGYFIAISVNPF